MTDESRKLYATAELAIAGQVDVVLRVEVPEYQAEAYLSGRKVADVEVTADSIWGQLMHAATEYADGWMQVERTRYNSIENAAWWPVRINLKHFMMVTPKWIVDDAGKFVRRRSDHGD